HVDYRCGDVGSGVALSLQALEDATHIPDDGSILLRLRGRPFAEVNHSDPPPMRATRRLLNCWQTREKHPRSRTCSTCGARRCLPGRRFLYEPRSSGERTTLALAPGNPARISSDADRVVHLPLMAAVFSGSETGNSE